MAFGCVIALYAIISSNVDVYDVTAVNKFSDAFGCFIAISFVFRHIVDLLIFSEYDAVLIKGVFIASVAELNSLPKQ